MALLRNVLIFHAGALGDFVLSFPVALALARLYPQSRVRYVTSASKGRLAGRMLGVESVDVEGGFSGLFAEGAKVPDGVARMLAGAHRVVSYVSSPGDVWTKRVQEMAPGAAIMHLQTVPTEPGLSATSWLCRQCSGDKAVAGAVDQIVNLITKQGLVRRPWGGRGIVMHPGAGSPQKCWPLESYRELALQLKDQGEEVRWVLGEVELERIPGGERKALEALGDVVVPGDYVGLLEELLAARVFVGNDSGPGHLAAMAGVPVVSLFGPTSNVIWQPVGPRVEVVWSPSRVMSDVSVDAVRQVLTRVSSA